MQEGELASAPIPPWQLFSLGVETYYCKSQGRVYLEGAYAPCFESAGAYAPYAQRLHTKVYKLVSF